ncbi:hypothetical protein KIPB_008763 [Kipferlia bialata]|uniref:Uncharacterized protein n=1 Tax=Kipferlia bialata TaxID=797122 RepID=A0A9K3D155_9EUKA|nr:hypothetical protein KIPB_008763 [Kipferlia bialata]|eukprot:g8763.t1
MGWLHQYILSRSLNLRFHHNMASLAYASRPSGTSETVEGPESLEATISATRATLLECLESTCHALGQTLMGRQGSSLDAVKRLVAPVLAISIADSSVQKLRDSHDALQYLSSELSVYTQVSKEWASLSSAERDRWVRAYPVLSNPSDSEDTNIRTYPVHSDSEDETHMPWSVFRALPMHLVMLVLSGPYGTPVTRARALSLFGDEDLAAMLHHIHPTEAQEDQERERERLFSELCVSRDKGDKWETESVEEGEREERECTVSLKEREMAEYVRVQVEAGAITVIGHIASSADTLAMFAEHGPSPSLSLSLPDLLTYSLSALRYAPPTTNTHTEGEGEAEREGEGVREVWAAWDAVFEACPVYSEDELVRCPDKDYVLRLSGLLDRYEDYIEAAQFLSVYGIPSSPSLLLSLSPAPESMAVGEERERERRECLALCKRVCRNFMRQCYANHTVVGTESVTTLHAHMEAICRCVYREQCDYSTILTMLYDVVLDSQPSGVSVNQNRHLSAIYTATLSLEVSPSSALQSLKRSLVKALRNTAEVRI